MRSPSQAVDGDADAEPAQVTQPTGDGGSSVITWSSANSSVRRSGAGRAATPIHPYQDGVAAGVEPFSAGAR
jgi:hypothetical protein